MATSGILDKTATTMLSRCTEFLEACEREVPALRALPARIRDTGLDVVAFGVEEVLTCARGVGGDVDRDFWHECFTEAARHDFPLSFQHRIIDTCVARLIRSAWAESCERDLSAMLAFTGAADRHQGKVHRQAVDAYHKFYAATGQSERADGMRVEELLGGRGEGAEPLLVVVVPGGAGRAWSAHRCVLRGERAGDAVLLVPAGGDREKAEDLARGLIEDAGGQVGGGSWAEAEAAVPEAYRQAAEVARIAAVVPGVRSLATAQDIALERQVVEDRALAHRVAGPLAPIVDCDELLSSVATLLDCDLDRTATAAALHINRRTLTSRLSRVATLTGFDPRTARGLQVLANALAAHQLAELAGPGPDGDR